MQSRTFLWTRFIRIVLVLAISAGSLSASQSGVHPKPAISPGAQAALDRVSADSLRGHLSFVASDSLGGRFTPSPGLDIAAEYIAAQFRRAGLEPAGDDGYFQTANWVLAERNMNEFAMTLESGAESIRVNKEQLTLISFDGLSLTGAPVVKIDYQDGAALASLTAEQVRGKVVLTRIANYTVRTASRSAGELKARTEFLDRMKSLKPALTVVIDPAGPVGRPSTLSRLIDPENRPPAQPGDGVTLVVHDPSVASMYEALKQGSTGASLSLRLPELVEEPVKLRNVVGVLRGSDAALRDTYVLVTAHYDHVGMQPAGEGDRIFNGANDDGSGTVAVIELASALASLKQRPKRSIVFMTFFGEERGLLGSRYYGRHPLFPIGKTVADVNLEQVGRTDSSEGPQLDNATLTGADYSDIGEIFKAAGELTGIRFYKHERNSDLFFGRSDNQALADQGVPAHTLCVAFVYPDYHGAGDHWEKIDYANMAKVVRCVALALMMIADNPQEPRWNEANPKTARYVKAWKERRKGER